MLSLSLVHKSCNNKRLFCPRQVDGRPRRPSWTLLAREHSPNACEKHSAGQVILLASFVIHLRHRLDSLFFHYTLDDSPLYF